MAKIDWKKYEDFVIRIECASGDRFRVDAQAPTGEAKTIFDMPFDAKDRKIFLLEVGHPRTITTRGRVPERMLQTVAYGAQLFSAVISGDVRDLFASARHDAAQRQCGLRLQLHLSEAPELADLSWEFLYDGHDFLALSDETPIVRYLDLRNPPRPMKVIPPLRILVTISAPHDLTPLDVQAEQTKVQEALAPLQADNLIELDFTSSATLHTLQRTLRQAKSAGRPYHVWHYIGHGAFEETRSASILAFCDADNRAYPVDGFQLGTLFNGYPQMRLVLLNACEGARPDPQDPFAGVAAALVERGIPAVIGMQFEVSDEAARTLAESFYEALVDGLPVDAALTEARRAVFFMPNWTEWATPVLFMRSPDGQIFDVSPAAQPMQPGDNVVPPRKGERQAQLASLYTEALSAFFTEKWAKAVKVLSEIVSQQPDYRDAASKLEEAKRQQKLANYYAIGSQACASEDWAKAVEFLQTVCELDAGYLDAATQLAEANREVNYHRLKAGGLESD